MIKKEHTAGFEAIIADTENDDLTKVMAAFDYVTQLIITQSEKDIEIDRAMGDQQAVVREQIKMSTLIHARSILNWTHSRVTGSEVYDEYIK